MVFADQPHLGYTVSMDVPPVSMKVSVAMCTYNGAAFIAQQLDSIATQTILPNEIVICDDGSTDATLDIINSFSARFPNPITVHRNSVNLGSIRNFEQAMRMCSGDIIMLSDQDDIWYPDRVERSLDELMSDKQIGYVFSDADLIDCEGVSLNKMLWKSVRFNNFHMKKFGDGASQAEMIIRRPFVTGATMAFKAGLRDKILPIPKDKTIKLHHDRWIALILSANGYYGRAIHKPFIQYRLHNAQLIGVRRKRTFTYNIKHALHGFLNPIDNITSHIALLELTKQHVSDGTRCFDIALKPYHEFLWQRQAALDLSSRTKKLAGIIRIWRQHRYARFDRFRLSMLKDVVWSIRKT